MEIKTKFEVEQEVYFMQDNEVKIGEIKKILIETYRSYFSGIYTTKYTTKYEVKYKHEILEKKPYKIFASKQDLLDSL